MTELRAPSSSLPGAPVDCPCDLDRPYDECCGAYHRGEATPATALSLMRSRYSAYVRGEADWIIQTHDPETCELSLEQVVASARQTRWIGLRILETRGGGEQDQEGTVTFEARYDDGGIQAYRERSLFRRVGGRWFYVSALSASPTVSIGRNERCPCGSGKKYKKCCGLGR